MVWTAPRTWIAGETVSAALLNTHVRDELLELGPNNTGSAWQTYVPVLTQSVTVTKTVDYAGFQQIGKTVIGSTMVTSTGAGSAGALAQVSLPIISKVNAVSPLVTIGSARIYDTSASTTYVCTVALVFGSAMFINDISGPQGWGVTPALTLASGDVIAFSYHYEAA